MMIKQYEIWIANLDPKQGTETGKTRPVLIVQSDLLNKVHPSTIICPITTNIKAKSEILRVHLKKGEGNVKSDCDIMIDQIRAIDNKRLINKTGTISKENAVLVKNNIAIVIDLIE
ncbi:MAG: type II toxin-antitoxin system PemK/MazF family toxin [Bacteroidales bacterium]|nr:type II toxin-antitoxin system PemK/MazF family toxin [Bacteroidales bacterium]